MMDDYKSHEDHKQERYLDYMSQRENEVMRSCRHLARRFIHSWNCYSYSCECDDGCCPKNTKKLVASVDCLTDAYPTGGYTEPDEKWWKYRLGEENNDQNELEEK